MIIYQNINIKSYNSFAIDARANKMILLQSEMDIENALSEIGDSKPFILGGGSNMLLTRDFLEPVLKNEIKGIQILNEDDHHIYLEVGAGEIWHDFVMHVVANNWAGVENLSLIPGTVGAAPIQNIGAYGVEVASVIDKIRYFQLSNKTFKEVKAESCQFGYRESIFKHTLKGDFIITKVYFKLQKNAILHTEYGAITTELKSITNTIPSIRDVSQAVINIRRSKLPNPAEIGNSGSFFKNPVISFFQFEQLLKEYSGMPHYNMEDAVKVPAAWLIEQCGWKGYRKGDYGVHTKQALVLVNYGNATGLEILNLSTEIIASVNVKFGITLEREVQVI